MFSLSLIPLLGCFLLVAVTVVGVTVALVWRVNRTGLSTNISNSMPTQQNQVLSQVEDTNTKTIRKYLPYMLSSFGLAIIIYLVCALLILAMPIDQEYSIFFLYAVIFAFGAFSVVSPIVNLFLPHWWLNAGLFILSWFLLMYGLLGTMAWRFGSSADMTGLGMAFVLPMMTAAFVFPITALIQLVLYLMKQSQSTLG